jgi:hypothetical protein
MWRVRDAFCIQDYAHVSSSSGVGQLRRLAVNAAVYGQPLFAPQVTGGGGIRDLLIVATVRNTVYAFDAATYRVVWIRDLGEPDWSDTVPPYTNSPCAARRTGPAAARAPVAVGARAGRRITHPGYLHLRLD